MTPTIEQKHRTPRLVGCSPSLKKVLRLIDMVSDKNCSVLITGETGTGKELVARAIHERGCRVRKAFVCINCGAIPEHLLEDELFGHVKGAYTSAHATRVGRLEQADRGTVFLDEIGTMNHDLQVKLLRVLQEREFQRLGSNTTIKVDVRIVAATNMDLLELVREKLFRADLYYRLNVFPINLPPLRQRSQDIPLLAEHFIARLCSLYGTPPKKIDPVALEVLHEHEWAGNVRELENVIESAIILSGSSPTMEVEHFPTIFKQLQENMSGEADLSLPDEGIDYQNVVCNIERNLLLEGLRRFGGNRSKTASYLNLKRTTLLEKMKRLKLNEESRHRLVNE